MVTRSFSVEFNAHWAVQLVVSTAQSAGTAIFPETVAPGLAREFPEFSPAELTRMLCAAAFDAQVPILLGEGTPAAGMSNVVALAPKSSRGAHARGPLEGPAGQSRETMRVPT